MLKSALTRRRAWVSWILAALAVIRRTVQYSSGARGFLRGPDARGLGEAQLGASRLGEAEPSKCSYYKSDMLSNLMYEK